MSTIILPAAHETLVNTTPGVRMLILFSLLGRRKLIPDQHSYTVIQFPCGLLSLYVLGSGHLEKCHSTDTHCFTFQCQLHSSLITAVCKTLLFTPHITEMINTEHFTGLTLPKSEDFSIVHSVILASESAFHCRISTSGTPKQRYFSLKFFFV